MFNDVTAAMFERVPGSPNPSHSDAPRLENPKQLRCPLLLECRKTQTECWSENVRST